MPLKSIHMLLTYTCNFECDHCFLYCSPGSSGTFTIEQVEQVLDQVNNVPSINSIGFEGGEAFLYYPLLVESVRLCTRQGLSTSIQTNNYWAGSARDAELWLKPLADAGLGLLEVSRDTFHHGEEPSETAEYVMSAAQNIGLATRDICINPPEVDMPVETGKGEPIYKGGPKLRGRAVEKLAPGLPTQPEDNFTQCPYEDLTDPGRVHLDAYGNVLLCQGLSMGSIWETPLPELLETYEPDQHPICGPLVKGGPVELARTYKISHENQSVDACHFCSKTCLALIDRFPDVLTPRQVYGLND